MKAKGQHFHARSWDIGGKPRGRTLYLDSDFLAYEDSGRIGKSIKDSVPDIVDDAFEFDPLTLLAKIGASFVPGVGGKKSAVCGEDLEGKEA